jgi:CheY-like chemotaxis protein
MISHELRTPLNAILGMAQILKMNRLPKESEEYVDIISHAGNSLLSLVNDILDFAKLEAGKLSFSNDPFDLKHLLEQTLQEFQYQAIEKQIEINLAYSPEVNRIVMGDPNRMRQVLVNLIGNAIKFTESGWIKVVVNLIKLTQSSGWFEIKVIDTGIGIRADKIESIFDKFSQIDSIYHRKHRGIGLGLAITKQLVEAMGGNVHVESEVGKGSVFTVTLKLDLQPSPIQYDPQDQLSDQVDLAHYPKYDKKILVVEDNIINQKIAKMMLEELGCVVDVIDNGKKVMEKIDDLPQYDLIFMDVGLPDVSGFEVVANLRAIPALQSVPIVAMTAHILERDKKQAFDVGMNQIIAKPINYKELMSLLNSYSK